ncbi:Regulator of nonsense transcripts 2, partial [Tetrabaena socialis]
MRANYQASALQDVTAQLAAARKQLEAQRLLRESNLNVVRPSEEELKQLDSSIKRNTAIIKKLRQLCEENKQAFLDDIRKTNQTKYVSEAVGAIADAPLRNSDVPAAVAVCSMMHQRYADFGAEMAAALVKALPDYKRDREAAVNCLTLLATFARSARELLLGSGGGGGGGAGAAGAAGGGAGTAGAAWPQPAVAALAAAAAVLQELLGEGAAGDASEGVAAALSDLKSEQEGLQRELET